MGGIRAGRRMLLHAVPDLRAEGTAEIAVWKYGWGWDSAGLALFLASEENCNTKNCSF